MSILDEFLGNLAPASDALLSPPTVSDATYEVSTRGVARGGDAGDYVHAGGLAAEGDMTSAAIWAATTGADRRRHEQLKRESDAAHPVAGTAQPTAKTGETVTQASRQESSERTDKPLPASASADAPVVTSDQFKTTWAMRDGSSITEYIDHTVVYRNAESHVTSIVSPDPNGNRRAPTVDDRVTEARRATPEDMSDNPFLEGGANIYTTKSGSRVVDHDADRSLGHHSRSTIYMGDYKKNEWFSDEDVVHGAKLPEAPAAPAAKTEAPTSKTEASAPEQPKTTPVAKSSFLAPKKKKPEAPAQSHSTEAAPVVAKPADKAGHASAAATPSTTGASGGKPDASADKMDVLSGQPVILLLLMAMAPMLMNFLEGMKEKPEAAHPAATAPQATAPSTKPAAGSMKP